MAARRVTSVPVDPGSRGLLGSYVKAVFSVLSHGIAVKIWLE